MFNSLFSLVFTDWVCCIAVVLYDLILVWLWVVVGGIGLCSMAVSTPCFQRYGTYQCHQNVTVLTPFCHRFVTVAGAAVTVLSPFCHFHPLVGRIKLWTRVQNFVQSLCFSEGERGVLNTCSKLCSKLCLVKFWTFVQSFVQSLIMSSYLPRNITTIRNKTMILTLNCHRFVTILSPFWHLWIL